MSHSSHTPLTVVSALVPREAVDALIDALAAREICASSWDDVENPRSRLSIFLTDEAEAGSNRGQRPRLQTCHALIEAGQALGLELAPTVETLPEQDWAESWKRFFRVQRVSERIVIRPSWEPYDPRPGDCVIDLDPGMSFGTGNHATTQACLRFLDALAIEQGGGRAGPQEERFQIEDSRFQIPEVLKSGTCALESGIRRSAYCIGSGGPALPGYIHRSSVLDMGCGSGILAIAARKLGFEQVAGFDNDPDAVAIAKENAADNNAGVVFETCDLAHNARQADVVLANILAPVLIEHAAVIAAAVNAGEQGALILSGILDTQYPAVRAAYEAQGFVEKQSLLICEWRSGWFSRTR